MFDGLHPAVGDNSRKAMTTADRSLDPPSGAATHPNARYSGWAVRLACATTDLPTRHQFHFRCNISEQPSQVLTAVVVFVVAVVVVAVVVDAVVVVPVVVLLLWILLL